MIGAAYPYWKKIKQLEILGEATFGIVSKAYDIERNVFVSIKYVKKEEEEEDLEAIVN